MNTLIDYQVWRSSRRNSFETRPILRDGFTEEVARHYANEYNEEESALAKMEHRAVRVRFFVVKATTTFEEVK